MAALNFIRYVVGLIVNNLVQFSVTSVLLNCKEFLCCGN